MFRRLIICVQIILKKYMALVFLVRQSGALTNLRCQNSAQGTRAAQFDTLSVAIHGARMWEIQPQFSAFVRRVDTEFYPIRKRFDSQP
jgi:hypothetical protein